LANTVTLTVKINDNGDLQLLSSNAEKAAKSTDKLSTSSDKATKSGAKQTKQNKGVAGATSNSTKAFSKMTTGITGGLVPAYAVLAANVFALTAAFGALRRAAGFEQLEAGLIRVGNAAGQNLPYVAENIRDITGAAVSMEAAMSSTALAFSSGFSSTQLEGLTRVAKGASLALGRDMEDALTRLVKGTAKLEPEILDELGIMVRLDDAVEAYATSLKKTADELTQFERRQAFLIATITQGEKKFGDVAKAIDPNPYDQLAASFNNLSKEFFGIMNSVLTPLIGFLASSPTALMGVLAAFGSTLLSTILPAIGQMSEGHSKAAKAAQISAKKAGKVITKEYTDASKKVSSSMKIIPKGIKDLTPRIKAGTLSLKEQTKVLKSLKQSERIRAKQALWGSEQVQTKRKLELAQVREQIVAVEALQRAEGKKMGISEKGKRAEGRGKSSTITAKSLKRMDAAEGIMGKFKAAIIGTRQQMQLVGKTSGSMFTKIRVGAAAARGAVTLLGTAFLNAIPIIGQVLMVASLLLPIIKGMFGESKIEQQVSKIVKSFSSFVRISRQLGDTLKETTNETDRFVAKLRVEVGVMNQLRAAHSKYNNTLKEAKFDELITKSKELDKAQQHLTDGTWYWSWKEGRMSGERLKNTIARLTPELETLKAGYDNIDKVGTKLISEEAIRNLKNAPVLTKNMEGAIERYIDLAARVASGDITKTAEWESIFDVITRDAAGSLSSIDMAKTVMADFTSEVTAMAGKTITPFDNLVKKSQTLKNEFMASNQAGGEGFDAFIKGAEGLQDQLDHVRKKFILPMATNEELIDRMNEQLLETQEIMTTTKGEINKLANEQKKYNKIAAMNASAMELSLKATEDIRLKKIDLLTQEKEGLDVIGITNEEKGRLLQIETETAALIAAKVSDEDRSLQVALVRVKVANRLLSLQNKAIGFSAAALTHEQAMETSMRGQREAQSGKKETASQLLSADKDASKRREQAAEYAYTLKMNTIAMEYDLLAAQTAVDKQRSLEVLGHTAGYVAIEKLQSDNRDAAEKAAGAGRNLAYEQSGETTDKAKRTALNDSRGNSGTMLERIKAATGEGGAFNADTDIDTMGDKVASAVNAMQPMMDLMGPEGALISSVAQGAVAITDAWSDAFKNMGEDGKISMAGAMEAASATLGALGSMLAESSKGRIAGVDDEIAAEKKRDGQSAASVAKIKKLEAKKEAIKRKAFEIEKKVNMARTIMNTAAGIMAYMKEENLPMAIATGVMGAIQLATIAGTSYKGGGGSAPQATVPTQVAVGSRSASVDLARGNNAGGEQAYMRGAAGTGSSMTDFTPAFTGAKYRASGGETAGFMVGEQGPEMFIPDRAGRIAPAGETANMNNAPTNINFSISAVDSQGVEELLINQKGNIIKMIREAANEHGEFFLEAVQEKTY
jgi:hypothetical protein